MAYDPGLPVTEYQIVARGPGAAHANDRDVVVLDVVVVRRSVPPCAANGDIHEEAALRCCCDKGDVMPRWSVVVVGVLVDAAGVVDVDVVVLDFIVL